LFPNLPQRLPLLAVGPLTRLAGCGLLTSHLAIAMTSLTQAIEQIEFARRYTCELLAHVNERDWFRMPTEGVSHIGWQVGHLAMAEYRLALERIRGARVDDEQLISSEFRALFGKGSSPSPSPHDYPSPSQITKIFTEVHAQAMRELALLDEAELELPPHCPHKLFSTRGQSLVWCSQHEMLHAGQIGLLRRLLGATSLW
jgi:hypothetical protein